MWFNVLLGICLFLHIAKYANSITENSKFFGNDGFEEQRKNGKRKKRPGYQGNIGNTQTPCSFGGGNYIRPKSQELGRTFFDLQYFNVEHHYNYNINCGGGGSAPVYPPSEMYKPIGDNSNQVGHIGGQGKPIHHKPGGNGGGLHGFQEGIFSGNAGHKPGNVGSFGGIHKPHRPFVGGIFNRPGGIVEGNIQNQGASTASYNGPFAGLFPSPPQIANSLSEGIQSFIGTIPAIGQSFQSILPNFNDFQFFQRPHQLFNPAASPNRPFNNFNRPQGGTGPSSVSTPSQTTTIDPGDIIYSDQIKPVHEDYDSITDPYIKSPFKYV